MNALYMVVLEMKHVVFIAKKKNVQGF